MPAVTVTLEQPPMLRPPSLKLAVPVGEMPAMVANRVTDCPMVDGFGVALRVVVVAKFAGKPTTLDDGNFRVELVPLPSWPFALLPQHFAPPLVVWAQANWYPAETDEVMPLRAGRVVGLESE